MRALPFLLVLAVPLPAFARGAAVPVATVDGQAVDSAQVQAAAAALGPRGPATLANPLLRRQLVDRLIDTRLLAKAAEARAVDKDAEFQSRLAAARAEILASVYLKQYLAAQTTETALRAAFAKDPTRYSAKEVRAEQIVLPDEAAALRVLAEAKAPGADFAALMNKYASGKNGAQSGDLGYFRRGRMLPEFDAAAFGLKKNQLAPAPVHTAFGWHVVRVTDVRGDDRVEFEDVREQVRENVADEARDKLLADLHAQAKITVDEQALRDVRPAAAH